MSSAPPSAPLVAAGRRAIATTTDGDDRSPAASSGRSSSVMRPASSGTAGSAVGVEALDELVDAGCSPGCGEARGSRRAAPRDLRAASRPAPRGRRASPRRGAWPAARRRGRARAARGRTSGAGSPSARASQSWRGVESSRSAPRTTSLDALVGVVDDDREVVGEGAVVAAHDEVVDAPSSRPAAGRERDRAPPARTRSAGGRPRRSRSARSAAVSSRHVPG